MPQISIVMPSLNVARYYKQCIESVLAQTFTDLEILCIDAGSTDGTVEIIELYRLKDNRIRYISSPIKSYGYQVNLGISEARGEYIAIVETDDYLVLDAYENLINAIEHTDCDYVKGKARFFDDVNPYDGWTHDPLDNRDVCTGQVILLENPKIAYTDRFIWLGLYKKSLMQQIKLNESAGAAYQDIDFALQLHTKAKKALYIDNIVYNYRTFAEGSSTINHKAFKYIADEYEYCLPILNQCDLDIRNYYLSKLIDQTKNRYNTMAVTGSFWDEQIGEMNRIIHIVRTEIARGYNPECYLDKENIEFLNLLLESEYAPYDHFKSLQQNVKNELEELKSKISNQNIVLVGCGKRSAFCHILVEKLGASQILAYADNNRIDELKELRSVPVFSVEKACEGFSDAIFVITSKKYADELREQLIKNGIKAESVCSININQDNRYLTMFDGTNEKVS